MKIQLDLDQKKIKIEDEINLHDFFKAVKKLLPDDLWKEFTFDPTVINNWQNPIVIKEYPTAPTNPYPLNPPLVPIYPHQPYPAYPWITCVTGTHIEEGFASGQPKYNLMSGIFNIDCSIK